MNKIGFTDFEMRFKDSPEYFYINNAEMIQEGSMLRFDRFDEQTGEIVDTTFFPMIHIFRIKVIHGGGTWTDKYKKKVKKDRPDK